MADYWKSQPRKHCDYCKCWIADNKPSRDFHERGKNHQENVKKKISELMKKGVANAQKKEDEIDSLREMEEGALRALKKDLQKDPKMAAQYGVKIKSKDKEASEDSTQKEVATAEAPPAGEETDWQEAWTDEGFVYYWNAKGERTWDKPPGYVASWERALAAERSDKDPDLDLEVEPASSGSASHSESEADAEAQAQAQAQAEGEGTPEGPIQTAAEVDQRAKRSPDPPRGGTPADCGESTAPSRTPPVLDMEPPSLADIPLPPSGPPAPGAAGPSIAPSTAPTDTPAEGPARKVPRRDPPSGGRGRGRDGEVKAQRPPQHWAYGAWQNVPTHAPPPADLQLPPEAPGAFVEEGAEEGEDGAKEGETPATDATPLPTPVPEPVDEPKIRFRQKKVDTLGKDLVAFKKRKMNARLQGGLRKKDADS